MQVVCQPRGDVGEVRVRHAFKRVVSGAELRGECVEHSLPKPACVGGTAALGSPLMEYCVALRALEEFSAATALTVLSSEALCRVLTHVEPTRIRGVSPVELAFALRRGYTFWWRAPR